ncbi:MAG: hypothetical protein H8E76_02660 [Helicobacteraceae bacterium]|nr:hypothetical protein [Candidatus Sulfurimonas ponti]
MGGFAGGDEGGYWDDDAFFSQMNKQNSSESKSVRRKKPSIQTSDSGYSIKVQEVDDLYDTISFAPCKCETFTIEGCDDISLESNSIYKAYKALYDFTNDSDIIDFFFEHKVVLTKRIPLKATLKGTSIDAAAFLYLVKEVCNLVLSTDEMVRIGSGVGADLDFLKH